MFTIRPKDAILQDLERNPLDEDFYKGALLVISCFSKEYLLSEKSRIDNAISIYKSRITEHDFNGCNGEIRKQIKELRRQLVMFNYLIISENEKAKKSK